MRMAMHRVKKLCVLRSMMSSQLLRRRLMTKMGIWSAAAQPDRSSMSSFTDGMQLALSIAGFTALGLAVAVAVLAPRHPQRH